MILRFKRWHGFFTCDECGATHEVTACMSEELDKHARAIGWAISKDHVHCYCPKCAEIHRNTGRDGAK